MLVYCWKKKRLQENISKYCKKLFTTNITKQMEYIKLNLSINFEWKKVYNLPYMITKDCNLRWFQYKLVHISV